MSRWQSGLVRVRQARTSRGGGGTGGGAAPWAAHGVTVSRCVLSGRRAPCAVREGELSVRKEHTHARHIESEKQSVSSGVSFCVCFYG